MRGKLTHFAEVVGRLDEAAAEVVLPKPIGDRPPDQRVLRIGQPSGKSSSAIALGMSRCKSESAIDSGNGGDGAGAEFLARLGDVAARQNVDRPRFAAAVPRAGKVPLAFMDGADIGDVPGRPQVFQCPDRRRAVAHDCIAVAYSIWAERFPEERTGAVLELRQFLGGEARARREDAIG